MDNINNIEKIESIDTKEISLNEEDEEHQEDENDKKTKLELSCESNDLGLSEYRVQYPIRYDIDFKIRLQYDCLNKVEFFRGIVDAYVNNDPFIMKVVDKMKEDIQGTKYNHKIGKKHTLSKIRREKAIKIREKGYEELKKYGLNKEEKEDIFEKIEEEIDIF